MSFYFFGWNKDETGIFENSFNFSGLGGSRMGPASIMRFFRKKAFMTNTKNPQRMEDMREL